MTAPTPLSPAQAIDITDRLMVAPSAVAMEPGRPDPPDH
jgi:hypothetical protein